MRAKKRPTIAEAMDVAEQYRETKVLVIDVERIKGVIETEFWGLGDYKNRWMPQQDVKEWPRTICASFRWFGHEEIHQVAEWDKGGKRQFAIKLRDALHEADVVTGHNINRADRKWINSTIRDNNVVPWPSPYKIADTLTTAKRELGDESLTLDALCRRYQIPTKQGKYNNEVARAAVNGDKDAQAELLLYNGHDVEASTGLFAVMLPLFKGLPHAAPVAGHDRLLCPRCGSPDVKRDGSYSPAVLVYPQFLCHKCWGWHRTMYESRRPSVRAI